LRAARLFKRRRRSIWNLFRKLCKNLERPHSVCTAVNQK
jgi:hypothetical protein